MTTYLIKNATMINQNQIKQADLRIKQGHIDQIASSITAQTNDLIIDAQGLHLFPGMIDDQVHFREPGLTHKGTIASESAAAIAGGVTSFMEMPNVNPQTTTIEALEDKYQLASQKSVANYAFYLGGTNDNLEQIKRLQPNQACGIKVFMGSSTGNMLVDSEEALTGIFKHSPILVATHCEHTPTITTLEQQYRTRYGEQVPMHEHGHIRNVEACLLSSTLAVKLAEKHGTKLHVLHLTTADELKLFKAAPTLGDLAKKQITAEVCVHHLFFNDHDYHRLGSQIKCNPAIKSKEHQLALIKAVNTGILDIIATDHAPHTWEEKQNSYFKAPSGLPLVQHALLATLEFYHQGLFSLETIVQKTAHAPALRFQVKDRGFIEEGYWADLVLVDLHAHTTIDKSNIKYLCQWSPFEGHTFKSQIHTTFINGQIGYQQGSFIENKPLGQRLQFNQIF